MISSFTKYSVFFIVVFFFPLKVASIIFTGLGVASFPPITLIMYIFSFSVIFYWFITQGIIKKIEVDMLLPLIIKSCYLLIVSIYIFTFFYSSTGYGGFISQYVGFLLSFFGYLILGVFLFRFYLNGSLLLISIAWFLGVLPILMIGSLTDFSINYRLLFGETGYDYLLVGDIVVLLSFLLLLKLPESKNSYFILFFLLTLFILFKNGSRTSFYAFLISLFLSAMLIYRTRAILLFFFSSLFLAAIIIFFKVDVPLLTESRILMVLGTEQSSSIGAREQLHLLGLSRIFDNLILGDMLGQINHPIAVSPFGSYMHSVFSHYSQFGVVPFLLYVASWLMVYVLFFIRLFHFSSREKLMILSILLYSSISLTFSRAFVHTIFEVFWMFSLLLVVTGKAKFK